MKRINALRGQAPRGIKTGNTTGSSLGVPTILMVLLLGTLFIACQEAKPSSKSDSKPTLDTTAKKNVITVTWPASEGANGYIVKVTDDKGAEVSSKTVASETDKKEYTLDIELPRGIHTVTLYTQENPDTAIATSRATAIEAIVTYKAHNSKHQDKFSLGDYNDPELFKITGLKIGSKPQYKIEVSAGSTPIYTLDKIPTTKTVSASTGTTLGSIYVGPAMKGDSWRGITNDSEVTITLTVYDDAGNTELFKETITAQKSLNGSIYSWRGLQNMKDKLNGSYTLENDIAFPEPNTKGFKNFTPIGLSQKSPFTGSLDGKDKKVSNLYIDYTFIFAGLFGYVNVATKDTVVVKNLILVNPKIKSTKSYVGALVGLLHAGTVTNVHVQGGTVETDISAAGGLVGQIVESQVTSNGVVLSSSSSSAKVSGYQWVGGLVGVNNEGGTVTGYATGAISGEVSVGGLVGVNFKGTVTGYATGAVSGYQWVGGLVGDNKDGTAVTGYALGYVIKTKTSTIGLVGPGIGRETTTQDKVYVGRTETEASAAGGAGDHVGVIAEKKPTSATTSNGVAPQGVVIEGKATKGSFTGFSFGTEEGKWTLGTGDNWPILNFPSGSPAQSPSIPTKPTNFQE